MSIQPINSNSYSSGVSNSLSSGHKNGHLEKKLSTIFDSIDQSGSGSITKAQFDDSLKNTDATTRDKLWAQLDPNNTGSVSKQDFVNILKNTLKSAHGHRHKNDNTSNNAPSTPTTTPTSDTNSVSKQDIIKGIRDLLQIGNQNKVNDHDQDDAPKNAKTSSSPASLLDVIG